MMNFDNLMEEFIEFTKNKVERKSYLQVQKECYSRAELKKINKRRKKNKLVKNSRRLNRKRK